MTAKLIVWITTLLFIFLGAAGGDSASLAQAFSLPSAFGAEVSKRQKVIDFEDEVVEGMNKRPLDSFNQISEANKKKKKQHLYRKRAGFRTETAQTISEIRYVQ